METIYEEKRCCNNCKHKLSVEKWDFTGEWCHHTKIDGFICTACGSEERCILMVGIDAKNEFCEMFKEKV